MDDDAWLLDGGAVGRAGDDVNLVVHAAERAGEAEHVGSDAAEALLGGIFVGDQADAHQ